jgi:hypothetical protein
VRLNLRIRRCDHTIIKGKRYRRTNLQFGKTRVIRTKDIAEFVGAESSAGSLTYQWKFFDPSSGQLVDIPGATDATLTLTDVRLSQTGRYLVWVSNDAGTVTSLPAGVNVAPDVPIFPLFPSGQRSANVGDDVWMGGFEALSSLPIS